MTEKANITKLKIKIKIYIIVEMTEHIQVVFSKYKCDVCKI